VYKRCGDRVRNGIVENVPYSAEITDFDFSFTPTQVVFRSVQSCRFTSKHSYSRRKQDLENEEM